MKNINLLKFLFKCQLFMVVISFNFCCTLNSSKKKLKSNKFSIVRLKNDAKISIISNEKDTLKYYSYSFFVDGYDEDSINRISEISKYMHSHISIDTNVLFFEFYDNNDFLNKERYSPQKKNSNPVLIIEFKGDSIWSINNKLTKYAEEHM